MEPKLGSRVESRWLAPSGQDLAVHMSTASRPLKEQRRANVDFPVWMVESLDREASRLGVTRQSIVKVRIAERLEKAS